MVVGNLMPREFQSREAKMFFLKKRADEVSDFISGLRRSKAKVYLQVMAEVTGIEALVTIQSFLLQVSLYCRKYSKPSMSNLLEVYKAHKALANYYESGDFSGVLQYLKEIKTLFELVKE